MNFLEAMELQLQKTVSKVDRGLDKKFRNIYSTCFHWNLQKFEDVQGVSKFDENPASKIFNVKIAHNQCYERLARVCPFLEIILYLRICLTAFRILSLSYWQLAAASLGPNFQSEIKVAFILHFWL